MFSKKGGSDVKKSAQKIADPKKDTITRLKHLRVVSEWYDLPELKQFFEENYSHIYYIFYDNFATLESELKQRASKTHKEELDSILTVLEHILVLLPELVHRRWQYHSIGRILKKLLHTGNSLRVRDQGMRLFLLWYQILMDNATEECHQTYKNLVPKLGTDGAMSLDVFSVRSPVDRETTTLASSLPHQQGVGGIEVVPLIPAQPGERLPELSRFFLDKLLGYMVTEVNKIVWNDKEMPQFTFRFLFNKFKEYYLHNIFPEFNEQTSLYNPILDLPEKVDDQEDPDYPKTLVTCQESVIRWLTHFTQATKRHGKGTLSTPVHMPLIEPGGNSTETLQGEEAAPTGSAGSTLSTGSSHTDQDLSVCESHSHEQVQLVRDILYSNRENINLVHEIFRQAFLMPFDHAPAIRKVVVVYKDWFQQEACRPVFLQEPEESKDDLDAPPPIKEQNWRIRTDSYLQAVRSSIQSDIGENIKAGMQRVLQIFITHTANVFLMQSSNTTDLLLEQVDMCKKVLNIYRYMVMNQQLEKKTWEQLLLVLLKVASGVLPQKPPSHKEQTLGGRLAQPIFQTLIVTWIKANLNIYVDHDLWNQLLKVLSSLTRWQELIHEWSSHMDTLTRVLARTVYNLDLKDLPLDRLSEQKEKRRRGASQPRAIPQETEKKKDSEKAAVKQQAEKLIQKMEETKKKAIHTSKDELDISYQSPKKRRNSSSVGDLTADADLFKENISRQRSLSGDLSPGQSTQSVAMDSSVFRSNSDSNLVLDPDKKSNSIGRRQQPPTPISISPTSLVSDMQKAFPAALGGITRLSMTESEDYNTVSEPTSPCEPLGESQTSMYFSAAEDDDGKAKDGFMQVPKSDAAEGLSVTTSVMSGLTDTTSLTSGDSESMQYNIMETSQTSSRQYMRRTSMDTKSENEVLLRFSESPSPSMEDLPKELDKPEEDDEEPFIDASDTLGDEEGNNNSKAPSQRENSLQAKQKEEKNEVELRSVLAGGDVLGWTPDAAVVLWRRMLGSLGNINHIPDPEIHRQVYEYLCHLTESLLKVALNQGVSLDNQSSPSPPEFTPPIMHIVPWLFEALTLGHEFKKGKLLAYRLLCMVTVRPQEVELPMEHLCRFYRTIHVGLSHVDQDTANVLIRHCGPRFFSLTMPGSTMLILDFIQAANQIINKPDVREAPRSEAVSILGSLICFPNLFKDIPVIQPVSLDMMVDKCSDIKDHIVGSLLKAGKKEPSGLARCIAVSSLGIYVYQELKHLTLHSKVREAIQVLLAMLKFNNKPVAQVASDMLLLLSEHTSLLLEKIPDLPRRAIEVMAHTIAVLLPASEHSGSDEDKKLLVSIMLVLLEWCVKVPLSLLLDTSGGHKCLLYKVMKVLGQVVSGTHGTLTPRGSMSMADFIPQEEELEGLRETGGLSAHQGETQSRAKWAQPTAETSPSKDVDTLKLAAKMVMIQLTNLLGHFPMAGGAAQLNSMVQEVHDVADLNLDELQPDMFFSPSIQMFVVNNQTLVSLVEIPAPTDVPGGGATAGLTMGSQVCRVIIRDIAGKYCWDNTILYGPPECRTGSFFPGSDEVLKESLTRAESADVVVENGHVDAVMDHQQPNGVLDSHHELPTWENSTEDGDNLSLLLQYIGQTSPECLLRPGELLDQPAPRAEEMSEEAEVQVMEAFQQQEMAEQGFLRAHNMAKSMQGQKVKPEREEKEPMPFQLCHHFINELGYLNWGKRPQIDLLKKTDKLIRELKHLDNHRCRETHKIAVIYVAVGQEDKQSILTNQAGSKDYEDFLAGLGWEVDLETHAGFLGGLQRNKSTGESAPYYATCTKEIMFHVSTRMPSDTTEDRHRKLRHLGNDEVHIVWSEHWRDYRRGIIPTEFGDVIIIIYPLPNSLYRIHILKKPEVPFFGPLFDGAILDRRVLAPLVRATAVNASRVKRAQMTYYQAFYEERARYLENLVIHNKEETTFEDFTAKVFAPVLPQGSEVVSAAQAHLGEPLNLFTDVFAAIGEPVSAQAGSEKTQPEKTTPAVTARTTKEYKSQLSWPAGLGVVFHKRSSSAD